MHIQKPGGRTLKETLSVNFTWNKPLSNHKSRVSHDCHLVDGLDTALY